MLFNDPTKYQFWLADHKDVNQVILTTQGLIYLLQQALYPALSTSLSSVVSSQEK